MNTYATFTNPEMAEKAAGALLDHGIKAEHISIVFPDGYSSHTHQELKDQASHESTAKSGITTTTAADAGVGAAKGAGIGLGVGALAALASVFVPGVGLVLGGGALALAIAGAVGTTAAGAVAGGVNGYLMDQGVPADAVEVYNRVLTGGGALLTVSPTTEHVDPTEIEGLILKYEGTVTTHPVSEPASKMVSEGSPVL